MKKEYDYIIVGQGLAGSCLALQLSAEGKKVLVYNDPVGNSSSKIAGGLINPITGRKMVLTWRARELFPFLNTFYKNAEVLLKSSFYYQVPIYRPFLSVEEQNEWQGKSVDTEQAAFILKVVTKSESENFVKDPFGGLLLKQSGYLDTTEFLGSVALWLDENCNLVNEAFNSESVNFIDKGVVYNNIVAKKVIFCEGVKSSSNPYFNFVKHRPVKGEVLKIEIEANLNKIYNRGVFVMPRNGCFKVGSNYNHNDLSWVPTESAKKEIETKLKALLKMPYKIIDHKAGVRPSVADRRPVLGPSMEREQMVIFNGLGTKGVSLAPYFSKQLANWLCKGQELDKEVNVERFYN